ncbi:acyl-CoA carboxylase subunit epsilon [Nocardiopsis gilva YIM 90087]|uniref:Acyl-CoA carboxylase subunit epsilon n=1 Tax=Nocardiopsis gilva YIM 90087 TaxID=1235441 RepID=A0A223SB83_9ACTN|nr:acyl-CoA carboxylase subunit epsilon [Nocardiopsis gilva]ASU85323.1 acyl-CoA carboxylase subunit epsilon [Nocardiopsis gilva YIM 90087]
MGAAQEGREAPFMRIVRGSPDDEEIAAITVAVLALMRSRAGASSPQRSAPRSARWTQWRGYTPPGAWAEEHPVAHAGRRPVTARRDTE